MKYKIRDLANLLILLVREASAKELPDRVDGFIRYLEEIRVTSMLPRILKSFDEEWNRAFGIKTADLWSAGKIPKGQMEEIKRVLGEKCELREVTDPGLVRGIKILVDDLLIDGSLKRRLEDLKKIFAN